MNAYRAPLRDMLFVLREVVDVEALAKLPGYEETGEMLEPILQEASTFASKVLAPLNASGDQEGCSWNDGVVTMPKGFKDAYKQFATAGWIGLPVSAEFGGQALPQLLLGPALEMWNAANVGFANGPLLNQGAVEAIELAGSKEQKHLYIPKLVSGEWTGTMCLTEPQAGSDLAAVHSKATPEGDHYRISGQKIFITFGEHDLAENIIHLVLARLPDAPEGTKGISLFIVPKYLVSPDGKIGERNDVQCTGIEHKLGLNANPTCTLAYGEKSGGAVAYLVGDPNRGLEYMFTMMNAARFSVGVQALGIADRAYQSALAYAKERVQGKDLAEITSRSAKPVPIIKHPDVRRMLMTMKAQIEAMRALSYVIAASLDLSLKHPDEKIRKENKAFVELMIPVVKGWCTETAAEACSTALQVFGGMGFIEETGIAQQYRDVRITPIYEGTTGIQAMDLVGRKLLRDMGTTATHVGKQIKAFLAELKNEKDPNLLAIRSQLEKGMDALTETSTWIGMNAMGDIRKSFACSVPYLRLWGIVAGGWQTARAARIAVRKITAGDPERDFYQAKITTARFYADHELSKAAYLRHQIIEGSGSVMGVTEEQFELDRKTTAAV